MNWLGWTYPDSLMTYIDDIANEYRFWPNRKTVTVRGRRAGGDQFDEFADAAITLDLTRARSAFGGIELASDERVWLLPNALVSNLDTLQPGDVLYEAAKSEIDPQSVFWLIARVQRVRFDTQWVVSAVAGQ